MPNPKGKNGTAEKIDENSHWLSIPPDDVLKKALVRYIFELQLDHQGQLAVLKKNFNYAISLSTLRKLKIRLEIPSVRTQQVPISDLTQAVINKVENDPAQLCGPDFIKDQLWLKMILAPRTLDAKEPVLLGLRPFFEVSSDGHEKLSATALRMGCVGFSVYGFKDKYTDSILFLKIYPDVRSSGAGGHIFLDFVEHTGYIPIQLTMDKGSEVACTFPEQQDQLYGLPVRRPNIDNVEERPLFYWVFVPLIQQALDEFVDWWNHHRVRHQHNKIMPSGYVPAHALEYPELFGALDCQIAIPPEAVAELRSQLDEEEGPASQYQIFPGLTPEFNIYATEIYERMGASTLTLAGAWDIFVEMVREIALDQAE
ncbi:hypothetical protein C8R45DRAFT_939743 [Mycena sanguinolenta]|nr:hypothetical protein C8R45DRAFT_939743 [Mycena sanguinolenta]